ncbi:MAG: hypothetical protein GDA56_25230 [Hormoscilla sp. GM7CHS1pb]|nr:hypothetical protein [Hormoscilla sp. GM7CHS1pb]
MKKNKIIIACLLGLALILEMPSQALAFKVPIHGEITQEVLGKFQVQVNGESFKFTQYAIC